LFLQLGLWTSTSFCRPYWENQKIQLQSLTPIPSDCSQTMAQKHRNDQLDWDPFQAWNSQCTEVSICGL
jgi:hypothetical protein